jgi:hypothetical protein
MGLNGNNMQSTFRAGFGSTAPRVAPNMWANAAARERIFVHHCHRQQHHAAHPQLATRGRRLPNVRHPWRAWLKFVVGSRLSLACSPRRLPAVDGGVPLRAKSRARAEESRLTFR